MKTVNYRIVVLPGVAYNGSTWYLAQRKSWCGWKPIPNSYMESVAESMNRLLIYISRQKPHTVFINGLRMP